MCTETLLDGNAEFGVAAEQPVSSVCSPSRGSPLAWLVRLTGALEEMSP
jgi:hypothetical protein